MLELPPAPLSGVSTVGEARATLRRRLDSGVEADSLLCRVCGCERARLYARPETTLTPTQRRRLEALAEKRAGGVPLAYLVGAREFFSLEFEVAPGVLIPRPETETLVETALALAPKDARVLDLGTGCGAVAVALARARPDTRITACDNSDNALLLAKRNAQRHSVRVSLFRSHWFDHLPRTRYDLIVANPPYVSADDPDLDPAVTTHEPAAAVVAREGGLACLREIIEAAPARLRDGGALAVEHGYEQAEAVARLMRSAGFDDVRCAPDLAGRPRVSSGRIS